MVRFLFPLLLPLALSAQGPLDGYLKGRGRLDLAPSFSFNSARRFIGAGGQTFNAGYRGSLLSLFAEYGLTEKVDLVATSAMVFTQTRSGLQDGGFFAKYRPVYKEIGTAGRVGVLMASGLSFPLTDYEVAITGALGQKALILPVRLILQWETPLGIFLNVTGGYNWRLDQLHDADIDVIRQVRPDYQPVDPPDFTTFLIKAGWPGEHVYFDVWLEGQFTRGGTDYVPDVPDLPQAYGVSYRQAGGTVYYSENGRSGVFFSGGWIYDGRNVSRIGRLTGGMVFKL